MARGGRRSGTPGQSYSNRTDLNQVRAPAGPPQVAPPPQPGAVSQPAQPTALGAPATAPPEPGTLGSLLPTQRPGEPLTHGLPSGPGGGPEVLQRPFMFDPLAQAVAQLNTLPVAHQTPMTRALSAALTASVGNASNPGVAAGGQ